MLSHTRAFCMTMPAGCITRDHYIAYLGLTTACLKARETGSVAAAARQLFFAYKKSFTVHTERKQAMARESMRCLALRV